MFARWLVLVLLSALAVNAIQRPDTKTTLRGLTKLPRMDWRFSLDFDSDRGFRAFQISKDPGLEIVDARARLNGSAADGRTLIEMAGWRLDNGESAAARREFARAADTLRKTLDAQPGNAQVRLDLASALHGASRVSEAESLLREAVKSAPHSATNWMALASFLEARAWETALGASNWRGRRGFTSLSREAASRELATEAADRAADFLAESCAAALEATRLAADSPAAHFRLGVCRASKASFETARRRDGGTPAGFAQFFSSAALPDFEKAAELQPENPIRLATAVLWRALSELSEKRISLSEFSGRAVWDSLSDEARRSIEAGLESLRAFDGSSSAGAASQALGVLRLTLRNDFRGAADDLRSAAGWIPESELLWECLGLALARSGDAPELAAICQARVLVRPSARNRVLSANAWEQIGNTGRAAEELAAALAANANDFAANLALANLLMRQATDGLIPHQALTSLVNAERAIRGTASGSQLVELALAQSIYHGLTDNLERAREILKAALAYARDNEDVAAALNAIGY